MSLIAYLYEHLPLEVVDQGLFVMAGKAALNTPPWEDIVFTTESPVSDGELQKLVEAYYAQDGSTVENENPFSFLGRIYHDGVEIALVAVTNYSWTCTCKIMVTVTPSTPLNNFQSGERR